MLLWNFDPLVWVISASGDKSFGKEGMVLVSNPFIEQHPHLVRIQFSLSDKKSIFFQCLMSANVFINLRVQRVGLVALPHHNTLDLRHFPCKVAVIPNPGSTLNFFVPFS